MGYSINRQKKNKMKKVINITCAKELIKIRVDVENMVQHVGKNLEIVIQAYGDVLEAQGYQRPKKNRMCTSGCIYQMNKILINWLKQYDAAGGQMEGSTTKPSQSTMDKINDLTLDEVLGSEENPSLITKEQRREVIEASKWGDLLLEANERLGEDTVRELNGGHLPKKVQLVEALLNL